MDKKPQKRRIILGGLLAGLLLIGIAIFLIVVFSPKPKKDTAQALNQHRTSESSLTSASSTQASK
ncbi:hypothetical protein [Lactococcus garvieae]